MDKIAIIKNEVKYISELNETEKEIQASESKSLVERVKLIFKNILWKL